MSSRVKQMADEEADRVEAEPGDDDAPEMPDADFVIPEGVDATDAPEEPSMEERLAMLDSERERHSVALSTIMGADFEMFAECPACDALGYRFGPQLARDPTTETCPTCEGQGQVLTGARNANTAARDCMDCQGQGYRPKVAYPETTPPAPAGVPPARPELAWDSLSGQWVMVQPSVSASVPAMPSGATFAPGYVPPGRPVNP